MMTFSGKFTVLTLMGFILTISYPLYAHQASWPTKRLANILPQADTFKQRQTTLTQAQIAELETAHNLKVGTEGRSPIFYLAYGKPDQKTGSPAVLGVVIFVDVVGEYGPIELSVAMGPDGKVMRVDVWEQSDTKRIEDEKFLAQFAGKAIVDPFEVGKDIQAADGAVKSSQAVANGVKRGFLLIHSVFQKH